MDRTPLLAVVYSARSRPWREIVEAAEGLCRLLWIVDSADVGSTARLLRKLGTVIDAADCTPEELIRRVHAEHPDGVTSYCDTDLHRHAWVAAALGLPGPSVHTVALLNDKLLQREALQGAGLPVPRFSAIRDDMDREEIERLCDMLKFPVLLKPRDGSASRDIRPLASPQELIGLLGELEHPARMIVEEQMEDLLAPGSPYASHVCVESIVSHGVVSHLGISGLFPLVPPFRLAGGFFPADLPPADIDECFELTTACLRAVEADRGCFRTEIQLSPPGRRIIEMNGRPTGLVPATMTLASGVSLLQLGMRVALGEHVVVDGPVRCDQIAYRYFREPPMSATKVLGITGLSQLMERTGVLQIDVSKEVGDPVDWRNGSLDRVFQVTGVVDSYRELASHFALCSGESFVTYEHRV